jgi:hypothetical protein
MSGILGDILKYWLEKPQVGALKSHNQDSRLLHLAVKLSPESCIERSEATGLSCSIKIDNLL